MIWTRTLEWMKWWWYKGGTKSQCGGDAEEGLRNDDGFEVAAGEEPEGV
jgi:hypothetical protein